MNERGINLLIGGAVALVLLALSVFTVNENELALRLQFSEIVADNYQPGLHLRVPFIDTVRKFERRVVSQTYQGETFLTSENKRLNVNFYIKWRIVDPATFYRANGGIEAVASANIAGVVKDGIKAVVAQRTLQQIVSAERAAFTGEMFQRASAAVKGLGIALVDVRVQRIDLVDEVSESVYQRMRENFNALAKRLRAEGAEQAERIRAEADRQRTEINSNATRDAQKLRGEGDALAAATYSRAYGRNAEFANFYRSLQAYRASLGQDGDIMIVDPSSEFFRYFRNGARR
jgi:modulator of FtsH protease HflC